MPYLRFLSCAVALLFAIVPACAADIMDFEFSGRDTVTGSDEATRGTALTVAWDAEVTLGLLMGEPVVSVRFRYEIEGGIVTLPIIGGGEEKYQTVRYETLPSDLREEVRLIDVGMTIVLVEGLLNDHIPADVGAPGPQGEWSFNVPGSPDWDRLIKTTLSTEDDAYRGEDHAKSLWKSGIKPRGARILSADVSLYRLHQAYMELGREEYRGLGQASARLIEGVRRSYGFDASSSSAAWTSAVLQGDIGNRETWSKRVSELHAFLDKLSTLPDALREGDNHAPYDQALEDADLIRRSVAYEIQNFEAEGIDPETLEAGYAPDLGRREPRFAHYDGRVSDLRKEKNSYTGRDINTSRQRIVNDFVVPSSRASATSCKRFDDVRIAFDLVNNRSVYAPMVDCPTARDGKFYVETVDAVDYAFEHDWLEAQVAEGFEIWVMQCTRYATGGKYKKCLASERVGTYLFDADWNFLYRE